MPEENELPNLRNLEAGADQALLQQQDEPNEESRSASQSSPPSRGTPTRVSAATPAKSSFTIEPAADFSYLLQPKSVISPESLSNAVRTGRFTWYNFLILSFWSQFGRIANVYFVIVGILSMTPLVAGNKSKAYVVLAVMLIQAAKDLYEDIGRKFHDLGVNTKACQIFKKDVEDGFRSGEWQECKIGSILRVKEGETIPVDLLVIQSSDSKGHFFLETSSLDGETNLKRRNVPVDVKTLLEPKESSGEKQVVEHFCSKLKEIELDKADKNTHAMHGKITFKNNQQEVLKIDNFALRGCQLQNVEWVVGIACHVGRSTKVELNSAPCEAKLSNLESHLNKSVCGILIAICIWSLLLSAFRDSGWNIAEVSGWMVVGVRKPWLFMRFLVMLWAILPVTLYILFESMHLIFGRAIDTDEKMRSTDTKEYAKARNTSAIEDMGQVSYVFSDKTGTLTRNEMHFKFCYIPREDTKIFGPFPTDLESSSHLAEQWLAIQKAIEKEKADHRQELTRLNSAFVQGSPSQGSEEPTRANSAPLQQGSEEPTSSRSAPLQGSEEIRRALWLGPVTNFFRLLALCHNVELSAPSPTNPKPPEFQAESPDEKALVEAAKEAGITWSGRDRNTLHGHADTLKELKDGREDTPPPWQITSEIPFTSARKRMSVIVRDDNGKLQVLTKGADNVMEERLKDKKIPNDAKNRLDAFSREGLRCLVLGKKQLTDDSEKSEAFEKRWKEADEEKDDEARERILMGLYEDVEKDLEFVGITAVEDRLQEAVGETIRKLRWCDVGVWVLTGDKVETAVEIAKSCELFKHDGNPEYLIQQHTVDDVKREIGRIRDVHRDLAREDRYLVLDGASVLTIFKGVEKDDAKKAVKDEALKKEFVNLAKDCISLVCCRLSPDQKAKIVSLMRKQTGAITLAIGDGANDVPMIQKAHVGIGIRGKEGGASVGASDIAISEFRFLQNLMFHHGRKAYRRLSTFLGYFMYKSMALGWPYLIRGLVDNFIRANDWNTYPPFAPMLDSTYAPLTSWSVALILAYDQDDGDEDDVDLTHPQRFYHFGYLNRGFNVMLFFKWILVASVHGITIWVTCLGTIADHRDAEESRKRFWIASFTAFTCLIIVVHVRLLHVAKLLKLAKWKGISFADGAFKASLGQLVFLGELALYPIGCIIGCIGLAGMPTPPVHSGGTLAPKCGTLKAPDCIDDNNNRVNVLVPVEALKYFEFYLCVIGIPSGLLLLDIIFTKLREKIALCAEKRALGSDSLTKSKFIRKTESEGVSREDAEERWEDAPKARGNCFSDILW